MAKINIKEFIGKKNITEYLDDERLLKIGSDCSKGFLEDVTARNEKDTRIEEAEKIIQQISEEKNFPFPKASNIKYPLLTKSVISFSDRMSPLLLNNGEAVKIKAYGDDDISLNKETGQPEISQETGGFKTDTEANNDRAKKVKDLMNWILVEKANWEGLKDRQTLVYSPAGFCATKTYFDYGSSIPKIELVMPKHFYWEKDKIFEDSMRNSQIIPMSSNKILELVNEECFRECEFLTSQTDEENNYYDIIEQHTYLDLDEDGYKEPYIVVFERSSGEVLRICANYDEDCIKKDGDKLIRIKPYEYFTFYPFIPTPDCSPYPLGLTDLLLSVNEAINTTFNQLFDSATIHNTQGGFISGDAKIRAGQQAFANGEFKYVDNVGADISKSVIPLLTKEPSNVLFLLLGALKEDGEALGMLQSVLSGEIPPNTQATTVLAMIEQGLSGFKAIFKRFQRSQKKELQLIYNIIRENLKEIKEKYKGIKVVDAVNKSDFADDYAVVPVSDEYYSTSLEKSAQANFFFDLSNSDNPFINKLEAIKRAFKILSVDNYKELIAEPQPPQPDPAVMAQIQLIQAQVQTLQAEIRRKEVQNQVDLIKANDDSRKTTSDIEVNKIRVQSEAIKRNADSVNVLSIAEERESGMDNQRHIAELGQLEELSKIQLNEQRLGEALNGQQNQNIPIIAGGIQPGGLEGVPEQRIGQDILPVPQGL